MSDNLRQFFYPGSICLCGVSSKEKSIGYELLKSIKVYGYTGKVYPVNLNGGNLLGYDCYRDVDEIEEVIDLAIIMVPKGAVPETIEKILSKGVKSIILITAGFRETGEAGLAAEEKIVEMVRDAGARLAGPNCMGVINTLESVRLNGTFVAEKPAAGKTAFLSQSGAIGAAVLNQLRESGIRFGQFISAGNKADLTENDFLEYWQGDENIGIITMYLESFSGGEELINMVSEGTKKPIIILKGGRTKTGIKAAISHTGALASNDAVVDAVLGQFGIIRAADLNELFNTAKGFESFEMPAGRRAAIITNAGGPGILAADACEDYGLQLAELSEGTKSRLRTFVHQEGSVENPVDLLPGGNAEQYIEGVKILCEDGGVDAVISIFVEPVMVDAIPVVTGIDAIAGGKPVIQCVMPLPEFWEEYKTSGGKPVFRNPEDPAKVLSNMLHYKEKSRVKYRLKKKDVYLTTKGEYETNRIMELASYYDIPVVSQIIIKPDRINKQVDSFAYPIVLKGLAREVVHKSELNAVKLNIKSKEELLKAEMEILSNFTDKGVKLEEFMIQPYVKGRYELLLGGFRDPSFGPVIMFGSGGKYVEVFNDVVMRSAYLCDEDIEEMIGGTKAGQILAGVRGEEAIDIKRLRKVIKAAAQMLIDNEDISEFDLNPLIITSSGQVYGVDVRILNM